MSNTTSTTNTPEVTLGHVVVFSLDAISLWSGRRRLKREDIRATDSEMPPKDVASLGSKKVIDPEEISDFEALKKEAHRECAKVGVRFLGGYAVPENEATGLAAVLDSVQARFMDRKRDFMSDYDTAVAKWVNAHPEWSGMLQEAALNRAEVDGKLRFGYSAFRVSAAGGDQDVENPLRQGLSNEVGGLASQLYYEIAQAAGLVMEKSLLGRDRVTQKILSPVRTIRKKLFGLSFLDKRVAPLIDTIDHILSKLPVAGHIDGMELTALHGLIFILSDVQRMQEHGDLILNGKTVQEAAEESIPALAEPDEPDAQEESASADATGVDVPPASVDDDLFAAVIMQPTPQPPVTPMAAAPAMGVVPGMGAGMAHAHYAVRKIMAPPPVQRRV